MTTSWHRIVMIKLCRILRCRAATVTLIGILGFVGSSAVGLLVGIPEPKFHDEFSYLFAADTFCARASDESHPSDVGPF
jgi:hypothetical protein